MRFEFATAGKIIFGPGSLKEACAYVRQAGAHAFLVRGSEREHHRMFEKMLNDSGVAFECYCASGEPSIETAIEALQRCRAAACDVVVGFGGGSVLDLAKAVAALINNPGEPLDYLEVVGRGLPLSRPSAPCIAIPTTAGTGSEVTRNAVLSSRQHRVKVSMRSPSMLPNVAVVDPELTIDLPAEVTASSGLDALTQLLEAFVCNKANPMTDAFCRAGLTRAAAGLQRAFHQGHDIKARENMSLASLFGGLALANAALGAVHGFAGPAGGMFDAPHGALCASMLVPVTAVNIRALKQRNPKSEALPKYKEAAQLLTGVSGATAEDLLAWLHDISMELQVKKLIAFGVLESDFPDLAEKAGFAGSMKGNPVTLTRDELLEILSREALPN